MKPSLLVAALLALTLTACGKKDEATATSAAPAAQPAQVAAAPATENANAGNAENPGTGLKADNVPAPVAPPAAPQPEAK